MNNQRDLLDWSAGYFQSVNENFGFDTSNVESQAGNNANYLMKDETDGRLYWLTPLKPQGSDSETIIAYSVIPADEASASKLNPQTVYVIGEEDPRFVNLDTLEGRVKSSLCDVDTNFCGKQANGNIIEFLPVTDTQWQVFGEINGQVKWRVDIGADERIEPRIVNVEPTEGNDESTGETPPGAVDPDTTEPDGSGSTPPSSGDVNCDDPATLSDQQIANCLSALVDELNRRSTP